MDWEKIKKEDLNIEHEHDEYDQLIEAHEVYEGVRPIKKGIDDMFRELEE